MPVEAPSFHRAGLLGILVLLGACSSLKQTLANKECKLEATIPFDVVTVDLEKHAITLLWKDDSGEPLLTINRARAMLEARGDSIIALTNGGIYTREYRSLGLYVEGGEQYVPLNLGEGYGNFYLKPNGVFMIESGQAHIVSAAHYDSSSFTPDYALQSGPLLVLDGNIHGAFTDGSQNCRLRSGIGVDAEGRVHLAISNGAVNFYDFATLFKRRLGCDNALYLDGAVSALQAPSLGRNRGSRRRFATFLAVTARETLPRQDSNLEPPGPEPGALPIELQGKE